MQAQGYTGCQLTPEMKQAIAMEVQRQLALENQEGQMAARGQMADPASSGLGRLLSDNQPHVFVVSFLVAQALAGQLTIAARDALRARYGAPVVWN
jgi:hypothetical protein